MVDRDESSPRVLIADDDAVIRTVVRSVLEDGGFEVVAEERTAEGAVEAAAREKPDVCLLDIDMPGDGVRACGQIRDARPEVKVVMLTGSSGNSALLDAVKAGAAGYLLKSDNLRGLPNELRGVLVGQAALAGGLLKVLVDAYRTEQVGRSIRSSQGKPVELTEKEWAVLDGLREGLSTAEIAERLYVSPVTVRTHVSALLRKLRVVDREALVRLAERR